MSEGGRSGRGANQKIGGAAARPDRLRRLQWCQHGAPSPSLSPLYIHETRHPPDLNNAHPMLSDLSCLE